MEPNFEATKEPQKNFPELKGQLIEYVENASVKQLMDAEKAFEKRLEPEDESTEAFRASLIESINSIKTRQEAEDIFSAWMPDQEMKKEQQ